MASPSLADSCRAALFTALEGRHPRLAEHRLSLDGRTGIVGIQVDLAWYIQQSAAVALLLMGEHGTRMLSAYRLCLLDPRARIRIAALMAIGGLGEEAWEVVPYVRAVCLDERPVVVREAITALGMIGPAAKGAIPTLESRATRIAANVSVELDRVTEVTGADLEVGAIQIVKPAWLPDRNSQGWWGVTRAGASEYVDWTNESELLALEPGSYDVYWCQEYAYRSRPWLVASAQNLAAGELATVDRIAGIALEISGAVPKLGSGGFWAVSVVGDSSERWVNDALGSPIPVPAGEYDVSWQRSSAERLQKVGRPLVVPAGKLVPFSGSGR